MECASEFLSEGMSGLVSQWVSDEMREHQVSKQMCEIMRVKDSA